MANPYIFAAPQRCKGFDETFFAAANFHVKTDGDDITARFLEAWHRLEKAEGGRVKAPRFGQLLGLVLGGTPVAPSTIGRWERGAVPDLVSVAAIAAVCGVHPAWLAFGLGSPADPVVGTVLIKAEAIADDDGGDEPEVPQRPRGKRLPPVTPRESPRRRKPKQA